MQRTFKTLLLGCLGLFSFNLFAEQFTLPEYQRYTLDNGLTVYLMEQDEVPLINVSVVVKAGGMLDTKAGLASMTAGNLLLGTKNLTKTDFEQTLDYVGAKIGAQASLESASLTLSMASKDANLLLPLAFDAIANPALEQQELDKYKERYLAGLAQQQESPRAMIKSYFDGLLYQGHPYAKNTDGTAQSVATIERSDLVKFHQDWYTPDNTALVITGDFDSESMHKQVSSLFGSWQGAHAQFPTPGNLPAPDKSKVLLVNKSDATESTFMIGGPGIAFDNPDYVSVMVVNTVLGGRFTSWLNDALRVESGLTYGASSRFDTKRLGGSFYMSTFTQTASTKPAIDLALSTYQKLWKKGIDKATLDSAKAYVKGQFPPNYETAEQLAELLGEMFVYGFDETFINQFSERVSALDVDTTKHIIERYFPQDNLQMVVVGKAQDIKDVVKPYGEVIQADITEPFKL